MTKVSDTKELSGRGFYGIGIEHSKTEVNVGTLMRSATVFGAAFVFTVGRRYVPRAADTTRIERHRPLYHYDTIEDLVRHLPYDCPLVGIELDDRSVMLEDFVHPPVACYLLGAEDHGLSKEALNKVHSLVQLPGAYCLNVATAGSIVIYDRAVKRKKHGCVAIAV